MGDTSVLLWLFRPILLGGGGILATGFCISPLGLPASTRPNVILHNYSLRASKIISGSLLIAR